MGKEATRKEPLELMEELDEHEPNANKPGECYWCGAQWPCPPARAKTLLEQQAQTIEGLQQQVNMERAYADEKWQQAQLDRVAQETIEGLRAEMERLRMPHLIVDGDCWFSCPLAKYPDDGSNACCDDDALARGVCTCGAEAHNAKIEAALSTNKHQEGEGK
jgi:hypothetical protein